MDNKLIEQLELMKSEDRLAKTKGNELKENSRELALGIRLQSWRKVNGAWMYISTAPVLDFYIETMIFNTYIDGGSVPPDNTVDVDWESEYGIYRTRDTDEAARQHHDVCVMLEELDRRLRNERIETKKSLPGSFMEKVSKLFR